VKIWIGNILITKNQYHFVAASRWICRWYSLFFAFRLLLLSGFTRKYLIFLPGFFGKKGLDKISEKLKGEKACS